MKTLRSIVTITPAIFLASAIGSISAPARPAAPQAALPTLIKHIETGGIGLPTAQVPEATAFGDGLAADADGNLYTVYERNVQGVSFWDIVVFAPDGSFLRRFGLKLGGLASPRIAVGGSDNLVYVGLADSKVMYAYTREGTLVREFGQDEVLGVRDVEVDAAGNVYALSRLHADEEIVRFDRSGAVTARFAPLPQAKYGSPSGGLMQGLAIAPDGSIWVAANVSGRQLIHLDANGRDLGDAPHLDVLIPGPTGDPYGLGVVEDVDFANGLLYVSGRGATDQAVAVLTPRGALVDVLCCTEDSGAIAVAGQRLYARLTTQAATFAAAGFNVKLSEFSSVIVREPHIGDSEVLSPCLGSHEDNDLLVPVLIVPHLGRGCSADFQNSVNPCPSKTRPAATGNRVFVGGEAQPTALIDIRDEPDLFSEVILLSSALRGGSVVVEWRCEHPGTQLPPVTQYEWKGQVWLQDPSGIVVDGRTGRPVEAASVRLEFSPAANGRSGTPGISGYSPQVNPQLTSSNGEFGWDVAEGFWRLRVKAFGYRPFTSAVFHVPPEVKGLRLKLRANPAQQRLLIDPRGRVGSVKLGARSAKRVAGLRIRLVGGRVRGIVVLAKRFRTAYGISLGSGSRALRGAYPASALKAARAAKRGKALTYRVARATFVVKRGRVVAISLGRP